MPADAIALLTHDHREVEQLFDEYRRSRSAAVVRRICTELTVHAVVEEKVLYPVLGADVEGGKGMRRHAEEEHRHVKDAIFEIERLGYDATGVDEQMTAIIEGVTDHVQEEESEVFPAMREQLGDERIASLGGEVVELKDQLLAEAETAGPLIDVTKEQLYELAKERGVEGRSEMTKDQLISALRTR